MFMFQMQMFHYDLCFSTAYGCINDWAGSIYLNKCYKLVSSPSTASNSSLACQRLGGQLATPNSELIHSFLLSLMTERGKFILLSLFGSKY